MEEIKVILNEGSGDYSEECPKCKTILEIEGLPRWTTEIKCPKCFANLQVYYDFVVMQDDEEWDLYKIKTLPE